jgi:hypothetical protein
MIFAYRSIIAILLVWSGWRSLSGLLVIGTMAAADVVSVYYGQDTTMRGNPYAPGTSRYFITWHNRFYSISQFGATISIIYRGADTAFLSLLAIQTAPFFMTLVKKGIISQTEWHILYTLALLVSWIHALFGKGTDGNTVPTFIFMTTLGTALTARLYFRVNKYIIWTSVCVIKSLHELVFR